MGGVCFKCGGSGKILPPSTEKTLREKELWNESINRSIESLETELLELRSSLNVWNAKPDIMENGRPNRIKTAAIGLVHKKIAEVESRIEALAKTIRL
jgi:hypothetical protein